MKVVDLFAGLGGFTVGAERAGARVVWAANHWPLAVEWHAANHPRTAHSCQDLHQADWSKVPAHDLLLAAPACQRHSPAAWGAASRWRRPIHHDASRSTAWAVVSACEAHRPRFVAVENVPQFLQWELFPAWRAAMLALGYPLTPHRWDAADAGVPQHRVRVFLVAERGRELRLPAPQAAHLPAQAVVDWEGGQWRELSDVTARGVLERVRAGRAQFGRRFVTHYSTGHRGRDPGRPFGTITTRDHWGVVDGQRMRMLTVSEYLRAQGFGADHRVPASKSNAVHLVGNAVAPPVAHHLVASIMEAA